MATAKSLNCILCSNPFSDPRLLPMYPHSCPCAFYTGMGKHTYTLHLFAYCFFPSAAAAAAAAPDGVVCTTNAVPRSTQMGGWDGGRCLCYCACCWVRRRGAATCLTSSPLPLPGEKVFRRCAGWLSHALGAAFPSLTTLAALAPAAALLVAGSRRLGARREPPLGHAARPAPRFRALDPTGGALRHWGSLALSSLVRLPFPRHGSLCVAFLRCWWRREKGGDGEVSSKRERGLWVYGVKRAWERHTYHTHH